MLNLVECRKSSRTDSVKSLPPHKLICDGFWKLSFDHAKIPSALQPFAPFSGSFGSLSKEFAGSIGIWSGTKDLVSNKIVKFTFTNRSVQYCCFFDLSGT